MTVPPGRRFARRPARWLRAAAPAAVALLALQPVPTHAAAGPEPSAAKASAPAAGRPNIILVTIDCLRRDRLFPGPEGKHDMPVLEALAGRAFRFDRAYVASPSTAPSHASLLTGLDPVHHGVRHDLEGARLADGVTTLADRLRKQAGYETFGVTGSGMLDSDTRLDRGFDRWDDSFPGIKKRLVQISKERRAEEVVEAVGKALDQRTAGKPLFLFANFHDPHADYEAPEPFKTDHKDDPYGGELAYLDGQIGALMNTLRKRGVLDQAIVLLAGSQGEAMGEHKETGHGIYLYETTIRVPLLVLRTADQTTGGTIEEPVSLTDVAPTLLEWAGIPVAGGLDGVSFASLAGPTTRGRPTKSPRGGRAIWVESVQPRQAYGWSPLTALIAGPLKVVQGTYAEWFDLAADPAEEHPLAAPPRSAKKLLAQGEGRLGELDTPAAKLKQIQAAVETFGTPWADAPFCVEKDFWPDPRLPEKVALNGTLFTGWIQNSQGLVGFSTKAASDVLETDPDNFSALDWIGFLGVRNHWRTGMFPWLETLQCRYPDRMNGYHYLAHYYEGEKELPRALGALDLMGMTDPQSEDTDFDRAVILGKEGKIDEAIEAFKRAVALGADDFESMRKDARLGPMMKDPRMRELLGLDPLPPSPQGSK